MSADTTRILWTALGLPLAVIVSAWFPGAAAAQDDLDGDGYTVEAGDCDDEDADIHPDADEVCDGADNNCDGTIDEGFDEDGDGTSDCVDDDGDGATEDGADCDDLDATLGPGSDENCEDALDNDCDGAVDYEDNDCLAQAEEQAGIRCHCDFPDPPAQAAALLGGTLPLAGMVFVFGVRRLDPKANAERRRRRKSRQG